MKIAVNTRLLLKNKLEGIGWFTYETMKRVTQNHPEHEFYFIFDRPYSNEFIFGKNVFPVIIGPQARHPFLFYLWFEKSLPKLLKKLSVDLFISPDGFLSLHTNVPSVAVFHDINYMHYPKDFPFLVRHYYHYFAPRFAKKANRIITVSEYSRKDIIEHFSINPEWIDIVFNGANEIYKPISESEKIAIRKKYTEGNSYFVFVGALSPRKNISNLLLAFDRFKTQTFSTAKLLIVGEKMFKTRKMHRIYNQLNFKDDVLFVGRMSPEELKLIYGASIALTFVPYFEGFGIPIIEAMNCGTAVITSDITAMPEVAGNAALLTDPFSVESISAAMIRVYADDVLREELIRKGFLQCKKFSWEKTAENFWKSIEKVI